MIFFLPAGNSRAFEQHTESFFIALKRRNNALQASSSMSINTVACSRAEIFILSFIASCAYDIFRGAVYATESAFTLEQTVRALAFSLLDYSLGRVR